MGKRLKSAKKRAERRGRAKLRGEAQSPEDLIALQEAGADEAVETAGKAAPTKEAVAEAKESSREKKSAPARPPKDKPEDNAWERLKAFIREVDIERKKINWPSIDDTWRSTWVTVFVIMVLAVFMGIASAGFQVISERIFGVQGIGQTATPPTGPAPPTTPLGGVNVNPTAPPAGGTPSGNSGTGNPPSGQ